MYICSWCKSYCACTWHKCRVYYAGIAKIPVHALADMYVERIFWLKSPCMHVMCANVKKNSLCVWRVQNVERNCLCCFFRYSVIINFPNLYFTWWTYPNSTLAMAYIFEVFLLSSSACRRVRIWCEFVCQCRQGKYFSLSAAFGTACLKCAGKNTVFFYDPPLHLAYDHIMWGTPTSCNDNARN